MHTRKSCIVAKESTLNEINTQNLPGIAHLFMRVYRPPLAHITANFSATINPSYLFLSLFILAVDEHRDMSSTALRLLASNTGAPLHLSTVTRTN